MRVVVIPGLPAAGILATHQGGVDDSPDGDTADTGFPPGNSPKPVSALTLPSRPSGGHASSCTLHRQEGQGPEASSNRSAQVTWLMCDV